MADEWRLELNQTHIEEVIEAASAVDGDPYANHRLTYITGAAMLVMALFGGVTWLVCEVVCRLLRLRNGGCGGCCGCADGAGDGCLPRAPRDVEAAEDPEDRARHGEPASDGEASQYDDSDEGSEEGSDRAEEEHGEERAQGVEPREAGVHNRRDHTRPGEKAAAVFRGPRGAPQHG